MKKQTGLRLLITLGSVLALGAGPLAHAAIVPSTPHIIVLADGLSHVGKGHHRRQGNHHSTGDGTGGANSGASHDSTGSRNGHGQDKGSGKGNANKGDDKGNHRHHHDRDDLPPNQLPEFPVAAVAPAVVVGSAAIYVFNQRRRKHETS